MEKRRIGRTGLVVSDVCLGTMTFGSSCDKDESFRIMDHSIESGIDFFDTAEIYPVPPKLEYVNRTEEIVGDWLKDKNRDSVIIATKVVGSSNGWFTPPVRTGRTALDRHHIRVAVEGSLRRLGTDYIDLYQTHWSDHDFPYEETMETLDALVKEGKIRYIGCSNENEYGLMKSLAVSEKNGWRRYESIQNNFSILNRRFEDGLAEVCRREQVSCLPYSPLGGGVVTGKYNQETYPAGARFTDYLENGGDRQKKMAQRFVNPKSLATVADLAPVAEELGVSLAAFALAWSKEHNFVASTIVGANTVAQLEESLKGASLKLDSGILAKVDAVTDKHMYPMG
ncbi:aldo/keto reductase [Puniceicoccaceae bacterium K14]|nr:aldo/keto reductase [Puniceicoccaceae bacterium K14]